MTMINIDRVEDTVFCTPQSGNLRVNKKGVVKWQLRDSKKGQSFRLTFQFEPFQGMSPHQQDWPFSKPAAPSPDWVDEFDATTIDRDGVFKYVVEVKDPDGSIAKLDPIIIIRN